MRTALRARVLPASVALLVGALAMLTSGRAAGAVSTCQTTTATSGAYSVKVCLTQPSNGANLTGDNTFVATVDVITGTSPGVRKTQWSINGQYLLTDFQSPHQFVLSTADFADGAYNIGVAAVMRDSYVTPEVAISLTFSNGNLVPPVNTAQWSVPPITPRAPQEPFVVAAVGDGAGGETNASHVSNALVGWDPDLFLYLGDVYEKGTLPEFKNWYGGPNAYYGRLRGVTTPVVGNHEYEGNQAPGYFSYWDNIAHYYSYDANGWHFIAIDSTSNYGNTAPDESQYQWLAADLAANTSPCVMVFWHHPLLTIGSEDPAPRMQDMWDLMAAHRVTLNVTGHDHQYQRWAPLGVGSQPDPNGIVELVVGGGGHSSQGVTSSDPRVAASNKSYGAVRMELFGDHADLRYYAAGASGTTLVDSSTVTCKAPDGLAPTTPASFTAAANQPGQVSLDWADSVDNYAVTGYRVYRDGAPLADLPAGTTAWVDTTVAGATTYSYEVDAVDAAGNRSPRTGAVEVTTSGPDTTAPSVPSGLVATPTAAAVTLSWSPSTDNVAVTGYEVRRDGVAVANVANPAYVDTDVPANESHSWTVRAFDAAGNHSGDSNQVNAVRDTLAPSAPANLTGAAGAGGAVDLSWTASTDNVGVTGYQVWRDGALLTQVAATTFTDNPPGGTGTPHSYQVRALDAATNASPPSNTVNIVNADSTPPSTPANLTATPIGPNQVVLSWSAATDDVGVAGYLVYRDGGAIGATTATSFIDTTALSDTTYSYTLRAYDAADNMSDPTGPALAATPTPAAITTVADTYVKSTSPTSKYGTATTLRVDGDPDTNSYLNFTVSGQTGTVVRARLRIYVVAGSSSGFGVHAVGNSSWSETTMTWNNAPAIDPATVATTGRTYSGTWVIVDITSLVSGNGTFSIALTSAGSSSSTYASKESGTPAQLLLDVVT